MFLKNIIILTIAGRLNLGLHFISNPLKYVSVF